MIRLNRILMRVCFPGMVMWMILSLQLILMGCQSSDETHSDISLEWEIQPEQPTVGTATISITLWDSTDQRISGADVSLEGNMSHPGMQPVFVTAEETDAGSYSADIEFTMGGDWFFLIKSTLPDSRIVERQININGVRSQ